jgi:hypothetical protein
VSIGDEVARNKHISAAFDKYWEGVKHIYAPKDKPYQGQRVQQRKGFVAGWKACSRDFGNIPFNPKIIKRSIRIGRGEGEIVIR